MSSYGEDQGPPSAQPMNGAHLTNLLPRLEEPFQMSRDASMGNTPDLAREMDARRNISDSSVDDDFEEYESIPDTDTSEDDEDEVDLRMKGLSVSQLPTGLCYDERMRYHSEVSATTGENVHPEDPRRIYRIYKELCEAGLVAEVEDKSNILAKIPLRRIDAREATRDECQLVHTIRHYDFVRHTSKLSDADLIDLSERRDMDSIYFNTLSYFCAKLSAGAAIDTCRAVVKREVKNAIAVIRPPGHHAENEATMGFCLFNNVCIACKVCQNDFGEACRKILILDWDVHHGNGCQKAFIDDPNVLYISIHVHQNGNFYPSGPEGGMDRVGEGAGKGMNINIPWPTKGMGDGDYMYAFQQIVMPIATEFDPDLVVIAAGFDAAAGDELGGCFVSPPCYAHMTHMLMSLANGKVAVCLEGGYNFKAISKSALAVTKTLMGEPPDRLAATQATRHAVETVEAVRAIQSKYWRSLYPQDPTRGRSNGVKLHDILRQYQADQMYESHRMTELAILRKTISKSFEKQVLASRDYDTKKYLLINFHDPPDVYVPGDRLSTLQKPHDMSLLDGTQGYVAHALAHSFGVIDVNIPEYITVFGSEYNIHDPISASQMVTYASSETDAARREGEKLAIYLWDNYIEPMPVPPEFEDREIILMGCGNAFHAVSRLISESDTVYQSLAGVVGFLAATPVRPVIIKNSNSPWISSWYRDHSIVFVSDTHSVWSREKTVSKRYGMLRKSVGRTLNEIMQLEQESVWEWIGAKLGVDLVGDAKVNDDDADETESDEEVKKVLERRSISRVGNATPRVTADDVMMSTET